MTFLTDHEQPTEISDNLDEQELTQEAVTRQDNDNGTANEEKVSTYLSTYYYTGCCVITVVLPG